jgi:hypothetical protein
MLEAVYREQRNPGAPVSARTARLITQVMFGLGALLGFAFAYSFYYYPSAWHDSTTGEAVSESEGVWSAVGCGLFGLVFLALIPACNYLPISFNGESVDNGGRTGTAWRISAAGLQNLTWGKKGLIAWSALDYVQDDVDGFGDPCFIVYFTGKPAVAQYLGNKDVADWNAGVSYVLEVANTNVSMAQTRSALKQYCPRLFRYYDTAEPAGTHAANDAA